MNTCQCCGKRKIGEKKYCYACELKISHGQLENCMKKKMLEDFRYCQFVGCQKRGIPINIKIMKRVEDLFFCSEKCKNGFLKRNFIENEANT
jgi:hypothetical protein